MRDEGEGGGCVGVVGRDFVVGDIQHLLTYELDCCILDAIESANSYNALAFFMPGVSSQFYIFCG